MRVLSRRSSGELDDVGWVAGCCLLGVARWVMFVGLLGVARWVMFVGLLGVARWMLPVGLAEGLTSRRCAFRRRRV